MAWIDIIVIAVLVIFTFVGMVKGFLNTLISLFGAAASIGVAVFCAKPVSRFLDGVFHLVSHIGGSIAGSISGQVVPFQAAEAGGEAISELTGAGLKTYLETDGLTFQERVFRLFIEDSKVFTVVENGGAADYVATDAQVASYIGERLAAVIIVVIAAVAVFIALKIAILLLSKLFNALTKNHAISGLDRTLGMLFGFAKGALLVTLVLGVFYLLANSTVYGWINNSVVTKWIYQRVVELVDFVAHRYDLPAFITSLFPQLSPPAFIGLI